MGRGTKHMSRYVSRERLNRPNSSESDDLNAVPPPAGVPVQNGGADVRLGTSCPLEDQHQGKEVINTVLPLPVDTVFSLIFSQEQFMIDVYAIKKTYDVVYNSWEEHEGYKNRVVTYTMTLPSANLGPKVSYVTEKQTVQAKSRPGEVYVVEYETFNTGIPYADAFYIFSHYCLTREDENLTRLNVWASVKYKKSVWGIMKTMIEKNTYSGMEALLGEIAAQVVSHSETGTKSIKRRRRPNSEKTKTPKHTPTPSQTRTNVKEKEGWSWLPVVVLASIAMLVAANVILYNKLASLEKQSSHVISHITTPATRVEMTGSWEDVARVLHRQDQLHRYQLDQWKDRLNHATHTLSQVEEWLGEILASIPLQEERLREALIQHTSKVKQAMAKHTQEQHANTQNTQGHAKQESCANQEDLYTRHDSGQNESQQPV